MADISIIVTPNGDSYNIKDSYARQEIAKLENATKWLGITTTPLSDGSTTATIVIDGESITVTASDAGSMAGYNSKEFIWNGTAWQEFGDLTGLGNLAYKDDASASYTPAGTINAQTVSVTPSTTSIEGIDSVGTLPTFTVSGETLTFGAGTLPTKATAVNAVTAVTATVDAATFTGTAATITVS